MRATGSRVSIEHDVTLTGEDITILADAMGKTNPDHPLTTSLLELLGASMPAAGQGVVPAPTDIPTLQPTPSKEEAEPPRERQPSAPIAPSAPRTTSQKGSGAIRP